MRRSLLALLAAALAPLAGPAPAQEAAVPGAPVGAPVGAVELPRAPAPLVPSPIEGGPFARGAVAVLAAGPLGPHEVTLTPCQAGGVICAGAGASVGVLVGAGRAQAVRFPDRTYWLGPRGRGELEVAGRRTPLAWNPIGRGTGIGTDAALEQPVPHR